MTLTRLIGDIHGRWYNYELLTRNIEHRSIQVGDFGVGFNGPYWHDRANEHHASGQHRFIRGNHDDPERCKRDMIGYIPDGSVMNDVMFVGGAWSIDYQWRTPGQDWWRDEECSVREFEQIIDTYNVVRPRVLITHDCPSLVAYQMFIKSGQSLGGRTLHLTRTGEALQTMFELHQPDFHIFGHWHVTKQAQIEGTTFLCLGIDDFIDLDLADSDNMSMQIKAKFDLYATR